MTVTDDRQREHPLGVPVNSSEPRASARDVINEMLDAGLLDDVMDRVDSGGLRLTGAGGFLPEMIKAVLERGLQAELTVHLGYEKGDPAGRGSPNSRNGTTPKTLVTEVGDIALDAPRDRAGTFEPRLVPKGAGAGPVGRRRARPPARVRTLAHQARGDIPAALAPLHRAVALAEPEGWVRVFVDEGPAIDSLLRAAAQRGVAPAQIRRLLAATTRTEVGTPDGHSLIDPLSGRELDVLRLLGSELSGPEIARELFVSLHTVRTHTKHIYSKLGVTSRRAAVRRAAELDLTS
jgi:DNA-binding NarL/FixJ family response regulator